MSKPVNIADTDCQLCTGNCETMEGNCNRQNCNPLTLDHQCDNEAINDNTERLVPMQLATISDIVNGLRYTMYILALLLVHIYDTYDNSLSIIELSSNLCLDLRTVLLKLT